MESIQPDSEVTIFIEIEVERELDFKGRITVSNQFDMRMGFDTSEVLRMLER